MREELTKADKEIGKEYALTLSSHSIAEITKEEFYLENAIIILIEAMDNIDMLLMLLDGKTPYTLVKLAEEDGLDFRELSLQMKNRILDKKLEENPMAGIMATIDALAKMAKKNMENQNR